MAAEPWQCPTCLTWIRADVTEHHCGDGGDQAPDRPPAGGDDSGELRRAVLE